MQDIEVDDQELCRGYNCKVLDRRNEARKQGLHVLARIIARMMVEGSRKPTPELYQFQAEPTLSKRKKRGCK
jgi:hypothetical protein